MATMRDVKIVFDLEPIVKLECRNTVCPNNLAMRYCDKKYVEVTMEGNCQYYANYLAEKGGKNA